MSIIAGIVHSDGSPVERHVLHNMASVTQAGNPDNIHLWHSGPVGLVHTSIPPYPASTIESISSDGHSVVRITADARIDDRQTLSHKLLAKGSRPTQELTDSRLILETYLRLGHHFLDHLIGDFAFAIWDDRRQQLLCANDHFGIRSFFYTKTQNAFIFASDLRSILEHPSVSTDLNETTVGDFLLFGNYLDSDATIYRGINRLPPATSLTLSLDGKITRRRYWQAPSGDLDEPMSKAAAVEGFQHLLKTAVEDRIRTNNLAVELSGGLDSSSIAAYATKAIACSKGKITAYSNYLGERPEDDLETRLASLTARHLGIPVNYGTPENYPLFSDRSSIPLKNVEPIAASNPDFAYDRQTTMVKNGADVLLSGFYADALFQPRPDYLPTLLRTGRLDKLINHTLRFATTHHTLRGSRLRSVFPRSKITPIQRVLGPIPTWVSDDFVDRANLEYRWEMFWEFYFGHSMQNQLCRPWLSQHFRSYEPFDLPLQVRYPYLDVRLINFMARVPDYLKYSKVLTRLALAQELPPDVIRQPKFALTRDLRREKLCSLPRGFETAKISLIERRNYINKNNYIKEFEQFRAGKGEESTFWSNFILLPLVIDTWLRHN